MFPKLLRADNQFFVHLTLANAETGELTNVSGESSAVEDYSPAWSPDGEWIAFRRRILGEDSSPGTQLWIMRSDGSEARSLTNANGFDHGQPEWSPGGSYLLYHRFPLQGPDIVLSVWILEINTGLQFEIARPGQRPKWG